MPTDSVSRASGPPGFAATEMIGQSANTVGSKVFLILLVICR